MKALKYILFLLLIAIIGLAIYIAIQPNSFEVKREHTINAPSAVVYNNVIDFKNWKDWLPWIEADPTMEVTLGEQTKGVGGSQSWTGKDGIGNMKTVEIDANKSIQQELQFDKYEPAKITWDFEPTTDGKTKVTWKMNNDKVPFIFKGFAAISGGFDKMIGPDFERGLEKLDSIVVESTKKFNITIEGVKEYGGGFYLYKTTNANSSNISSKMAKQYGAIMSYITQNNIQMAGMPLTVYNEMNTESGSVIMSNGIPVTEKIEFPADSNISCGYIPKTKVLKTTLLGNYTNLPEAWTETMGYLGKNNLEASDIKPFEIYTTDPAKVPNPADWRTEIYIPIK
ncbi:effector-binding domain-containing protein [Flaviramulus basaltis]|uniref:Effector-binding domain-containing protein n=1 Tax=Flaviramulus basaltis TaxID=369401 RepID=A0A1K2INU1_9FLAO|nr:SRPBCC family protein [Flaviramulus basaltis]SFZ93922.1 effector-binding domain-containing protein [Flaviramulus basaltis]